ncbi:MAG: hypothetical protein NUV64_02185 [Parcubacteria group bacterium]|nr:hypothetical protein [Parcubacteria group bacterium]MCR4342822.1 hypothetical protein [Patescibacteria group bacterium]
MTPKEIFMSMLFKMAIIIVSSSILIDTAVDIWHRMRVKEEDNTPSFLFSVPIAGICIVVLYLSLVHLG